MPTSIRSLVIVVLNVRASLFVNNPIIRRKTSAIGISAALFADLASQFIAAVKAGEVSRCTPATILATYDEDEGVAFVDRALLASFFVFIEPLMPKDMLENFMDLRKLSDIRFPSEW